ncbi:inositol monophosphatase family protein [Alkalimarinus coralli]|uniref:inositol monophosphatase family protein n=1 Tax=Alkalimarinus coralli TaxID=2935863 RepID=UPI00202B9D69|nr:inositol monophosphatase family protein [Alkalimarinus coralli]
MQPVINIALRAARQANEYILQTLDKQPVSFSDPEACAKQIKNLENTTYRVFFDALKKAYPTHYIGEPGEPVSDQHENSWSISLIHSPENILRHLPFTGYSITNYQKGKVEHALFINPITDEEFSASRGHGAALNGKRIRVSDTRNLNQSLLTSNLLENARNMENAHVGLELISDLAQATFNVRATGCEAADLAYVAAGRFDAAVLTDVDTSELPAVLLICQEAGVLTGDFKGAPTSSGTKRLVAANAKLFKSLIQKIHNYNARF